MRSDKRPGDVESGLKVMRSDKRPGDIETKTFLRLSVRQGSELQDSMVSPADQLKGNQGTYDMQPLKPTDCQNSDSNGKNIVAGIQFLPLHHRIPTRDEIISVESNYCCEGTSKNPLERTHMNVSEKDGTSAASRTSQGRFVNSPSNADPHLVDNENFEFDKGKISAPSAVSRSFFISNHQLSSTDLKIQQNTNLHDSRWPVNLDLEGRMDSCSQPKNSVSECCLENKTFLFFDPAPTSNNPLSKMSRERFLKIPKCSGFELFPGLIASEKTEVNSIQKGVKCNHNVESMRIYSTGDPVTDRGQWPTFFQTTHSLLITKKTDINLLKGGDICGSTMANGNTTSNAYNCDRGKRKLKPQSSSRFITSDTRRNFDRVKTSKVALKYESPAETDPVDMRSFMETYPECGANSTPMNKDISIGRDLSPKKVTPFLKLAGCRRPDIELPDIKLELPTPPDTGTLSTALSLDFNILMAFAEESKNKLDLNLDSPSTTDPSNCWVKRLKLSSSNSARGTNSSDTNIYLSHEKMNKFSTKVLNSSAHGLETTVMKARDKGPIVSDEGHLRKKEHCLLRNPTNEGKDVFLSHAWIQRWRQKGSCITDSNKLMSNVPKSSNSAQEDLHKKQFPSTAAMALMGRTIKGFRPCELQKRGSFIVWNTKVF